MMPTGTRAPFAHPPRPWPSRDARLHREAAGRSRRCMIRFLARFPAGDVGATPP